MNTAKEFMENEYLTKGLSNLNFMRIKKFDLERKNKLEELNKNQDVEMVNHLKKKIELCKNQIKTYEKEKQAAIIATREEIRNNLLVYYLNIRTDKNLIKLLIKRSLIKYITIMEMQLIMVKIIINKLLMFLKLVEKDNKLIR